MASPNPAVRLIWVQKHPESDPDRVAIYDRDPAHPATRGNPAGELYIADFFPRQVAETVAVNQKLQRSPGGPPDLIVLNESDAQRIEQEMAEEYERRLEEAREEAVEARQAANPMTNMPEEVAVWLARAGLTVAPMPGLAPSALAAPVAPPTPTEGGSSGRGAGDTRAEETGVSTAVEAGPVPGSDEKAGEGTKSGEQEGVRTADAPDDDDDKGSARRSPRNR